jgi:hypothetical protein
MGRLRVLARRFRFSRQHELIHAGSCDRWGTVIKGDVLVRDWASGSALATLLE